MDEEYWNEVMNYNLLQSYPKKRSQSPPQVVYTPLDEPREVLLPNGQTLVRAPLTVPFSALPFKEQIKLRQRGRGRTRPRARRRGRWEHVFDPEMQLYRKPTRREHLELSRERIEQQYNNCPPGDLVCRNDWARIEHHRQPTIPTFHFCFHKTTTFNKIQLFFSPQMLSKPWRRKEKNLLHHHCR